MNYYISDWHYNHKNCMAYDNRPFKTVEEMNQELIDRWNKKVTNSDKVYVLGDMFWCNVMPAVRVMNELNGTKVLIKGNHDKCYDPAIRSCFEYIKDYDEIVDGQYNIVLSHYPIVCFKNHFYGWYHLYGHVHSSFEWNMMEHNRYLMEELYTKKCNMYNVGAMMPYINYTPRTLDEIISGYNTWKGKNNEQKEEKEA